MNQRLPQIGWCHARHEGENRLEVVQREFYRYDWRWAVNRKGRRDFGDLGESRMRVANKERRETFIPIGKRAQDTKRRGGTDITHSFFSHDMTPAAVRLGKPQPLLCVSVKRNSNGFCRRRNGRRKRLCPIYFERRDRTVTDLTSAEIKEIVGGYYLVMANNVDEVQEIAQDFPDYDLGNTVEIREIMVFDQ